ncbi:MAG TPA: hypothetical protein VHT91_50415 [Kofleriaceae bacterium]|jgi:hypothetical protein|nr:hypothetical protein [Kofleriaceae bacterium]
MISRYAIVCVALGVALGAAATWLFARPAEATAVALRERPADRAAPPPIVIERGGARAEDIRSYVGEEVRAALSERAAATAPTEPAQAEAAVQPLAPTPAFAPAKDHITQRIAQGTWTTADRDYLHGALGAVNRTERMELIREFLIAANTGKVRVLTGGPPF